MQRKLTARAEEPKGIQLTQTKKHAFKDRISAESSAAATAKDVSRGKHSLTRLGESNNLWFKTQTCESTLVRNVHQHGQPEAIRSWLRAHERLWQAPRVQGGCKLPTVDETSNFTRTVVSRLSILHDHFECHISLLVSRARMHGQDGAGRSLKRGGLSEAQNKVALLSRIQSVDARSIAARSYYVQETHVMQLAPSRHSVPRRTLFALRRKCHDPRWEEQRTKAIKRGDKRAGHETR